MHLPRLRLGLQRHPKLRRVSEQTRLRAVRPRQMGQLVRKREQGPAVPGWLSWRGG